MRRRAFHNNPCPREELEQNLEEDPSRRPEEL